MQSTTVKSLRRRYNIQTFCEKLVRFKSMCSHSGLVSRSTTHTISAMQQVDHSKYESASPYAKVTAAKVSKGIDEETRWTTSSDEW